MNQSKKNMIRWWVVLAAVLVVYNVLAFALPFQKTSIFWMSYLFTLVAIAAQIYVVRTAFYQGEGVKSKFYGFPIARIGVMYLGAQIVLGLVFMGVGVHVPTWLPLVLYVLMLGAAIIGFIAVDVVRDEVVRQEVKMVIDTSAMRSLQASVNGLVMGCATDEVRKAVRELAEAMRYSDPVSSDALREIEAELDACVEELKQTVGSSDGGAALALCRKADTLLAERNRLCKLNKGR